MQRSGLQVQGGFIIGFDHDPPEIFRRQFDLIQDNGIVMAMVGLLQAPKGTELYKRLEREGRLLGEYTGNNVIDDTNIVTRMDRETLRSNYRALVQALYQPRNYYNRVRNFLAEYKEPAEKPPLTKDSLLAVLRCFFWLGLIRKGRTHFWRVFLWACVRKRESLQNFLGLAILGYHFRPDPRRLVETPATGAKFGKPRQESSRGFRADHRLRGINRRHLTVCQRPAFMELPAISRAVAAVEWPGRLVFGKAQAVKSGVRG